MAGPCAHLGSLLPKVTCSDGALTAIPGGASAGHWRTQMWGPWPWFLISTPSPSLALPQLLQELLPYCPPGVTPLDPEVLIQPKPEQWVGGFWLVSAHRNLLLDVSPTFLSLWPSVDGLKGTVGTRGYLLGVYRWLMGTSASFSHSGRSLSWSGPVPGMGVLNGSCRAPLSMSVRSPNRDPRTVRSRPGS